MKSGALNPAATGVRPNSLVAGTALDVADGELVGGALAEDATDGDVVPVGDGTVMPQDADNRQVAATRARQSRPYLLMPLSATADRWPTGRHAPYHRYSRDRRPVPSHGGATFADLDQAVIETLAPILGRILARLAKPAEDVAASLTRLDHAGNQLAHGISHPLE